MIFVVQVVLDLGPPILDHVLYTNRRCMCATKEIINPLVLPTRLGQVLLCELWCCRAIVALGIGALLFGYCELFYGMDFLSIFNGDEYIQRRIARQIEVGYWERVLADTGFVLRGLEDVMRTPLFNIPGYSNVLPHVFRLSGPNFHPISFAYALAIISIWLSFKGIFVSLTSVGEMV